MLSSPFINKSIVTLIFITTCAFLFPFLTGISSLGIFDTLINNKDNFNFSLGRSLSFAFISSSINVVFGFIGAILLGNFTHSSKFSKYLTIFLLPFTLGNISTAFIFKLLLANTNFFDFIVQKGVIPKFIILILIQLWQFGFLFLYLFWMNIQKIPRTTIDFAVSAKLKYSEKIRDIILPSCRNLFILLFLIGFIYSFYEEAKIQFILKASQGTHTELINHWLLRNYQSNLLISAKYASQYIFNVGIIVFLIVILAFTVFAFISNIFLRRMSSPTSFVQKLLIIFENKYFRKINANFLTIILVSLITLPIIIVFFKSKMRLSSDLYALIFPVVITCIAALSSTSFAILFGISARLGWKSRLKDFSNQSAIFLILLFILLLIPPICILISGFKWMSLIGYNSISIIYIVWIIGHTILSLPLLGSFILSVHFNVRNSELDYLKAHFIKQKDIFIWSFLKRFKLEYLLTFIISFSLIWNEALLNRIMSAKIHSFASSLEMLYIGRGADYSKALGYLIISILISASIIVIWKRISSKTIKFI